MKGNKNLYVDMKTNRKLSGVVREAIDTFPGGLCFAMSDGRPVLVNRKMNYLFLKLTGHTILDAEEAWKELRVFPECQDGNATATLRQVRPVICPDWNFIFRMTVCGSSHGKY